MKLTMVPEPLRPLAPCIRLCQARERDIEQATEHSRLLAEHVAKELADAESKLQAWSHER